MRVLFIRHGESEENVTSNTLFNPNGPPPSTEAILKLINETDGPMVDRNLSSLGKQQAKEECDLLCSISRECKPIRPTH